MASADGRARSRRVPASVGYRVDDETIGGLLDGCLEGDTRDAALAAVLASDEEYEVFADTGAVLREAESNEIVVSSYRVSASRKEGADRLRPHVARWVEERGAVAVAARAELKADAVRRFVRGTVTPLAGALDAYDEMLAEESAGPSTAGILARDVPTLSGTERVRGCRIGLRRRSGGLYLRVVEVD